MKILKKKVVKKIRKPEYPMKEEENGRPCECCRAVIPYGSSMTSISARVHPHLTVSCYFCNECADGDAETLITDAVEARTKQMRELV